MADNADAGTGSGSGTEVSFKVKTSGDKSHSITMAQSAKVLDLKTKLAGEDFENVPVERQRLIYSGRVMKNDDALSVYKIKTGNTIHMVKSAASNPAPAPSSASAAPVPQAVPQNMAAGTAANNILAGLTGARFAGHANLPSRDLFGADGGMGAPPSEDQMADMLSNPAIAQTMNEALNNPAFIDMVIQQNPAFANMPNARELIQSPFFRNMITNPETIRQAARMRRLLSPQGAGAFPAPGLTDTTPEAAPSGANPTGTGADNQAAQNPFMMPPFGLNPFTGMPAGAANANNPFAALFGTGAPAAAANPATGAATGTATGTERGDSAPAAAAGSTGQTGSAATDAAGANNAAPPANPFASLFGGAGADFLPPGMGALTPEMVQQAMQMLGPAVGGGSMPAAPPDNRPPEERYAEQLRQLNDMGFYDFDRNVSALRRSGGSVQGAIDQLLNGS